MARFVPDANVLLGWLWAHPIAETFIGELEASDEVFATQILLPECASAISAAVFHRRLRRTDGQTLLTRLADFPLQPVDSHQQFARALDLADRFQHRNSYDMQYVAVAELMDAQIVTMDRGVRHAAEAVGVGVRFLA